MSIGAKHIKKYISDVNAQYGSNIAINGSNIIKVDTNDYTDSQEIKELLELLKSVPKIWIDKLLVSTKAKLKVFEDDI